MGTDAIDLPSGLFVAIVTAGGIPDQDWSTMA